VSVPGSGRRSISNTRRRNRQSAGRGRLPTV